MKSVHKLWAALAVLIILSPLGLIIPEYFKADGAWGEWGPDEMRILSGYIPKGLGKLSSLWNAPLPDYTFKGWENKGPARMSLAYVVSAVTGVIAVIIVMFFVGKILSKKGGK